MFRRTTPRVPQPKPVAQRYRELARAHQIAEARRSHPHLFKQPLQ